MHCGNGIKKKEKREKREEKKKGEAKEAPEHNSDISSKSTGKGLPARAALEFLPFATKASEATRSECGRRFMCARGFTRGEINETFK